jgi:hypothetical protein
MRVRGFEVVGRAHGLSSTVERRSRLSETTLAPGNGRETAFLSGQAPLQSCASLREEAALGGRSMPFSGVGEDDLGSGAPTTPLARLCTGYR